MDHDQPPQATPPRDNQWRPPRSRARPAVLVGGALALAAAAALATAVVLKSPAGDEPAQAAAKTPAAATGKAPTPKRAAAPSCPDCGVVQAVTAVQRKGEGTGLGAVAGGVIGGVIGNQMGGGSGRDAMTVIGAVGGGVAGHEIEKRQRATTVYRIEVRMADGSLRTLTQAQPLAVGQNVRVVGEQAVATGGAGGTRGAVPG